MLRKVGLFDGYTPRQDPNPFANLFNPECRTKVEDDDEEEYEEECEDEEESEGEDGSDDEAGG